MGKKKPSLISLKCKADRIDVNNPTPISPQSPQRAGPWLTSGSKASMDIVRPKFSVPLLAPKLHSVSCNLLGREIRA